VSNQLSFLFNKLLGCWKYTLQYLDVSYAVRFFRLVLVKAVIRFAFLFKKSTRSAWTRFFELRYADDGFNYHTTQKIPAYDTSIYLRLHFNCPDSGRKA